LFPTIPHAGTEESVIVGPTADETAINTGEGRTVVIIGPDNTVDPVSYKVKSVNETSLSPIGL
jgi:predicted class III extradiol MEMO1 family dioxygenase